MSGGEISILIGDEWVPLEGVDPDTGDRIAVVDNDEQIPLATRVNGEWTMTIPAQFDNRLRAALIARWRAAMRDVLDALTDMCDAVSSLDPPHPAKRRARPPRAINPTRNRTPRQVNRYRGGHRG